MVTLRMTEGDAGLPGQPGDGGRGGGCRGYCGGDSGVTEVRLQAGGAALLQDAPDAAGARVLALEGGGRGGGDGGGGRGAGCVFMEDVGLVRDGTVRLHGGEGGTETEKVIREQSSR